MKKSIVLLAVFFCIGAVGAAEVYVDNLNGKEKNDGRSAATAVRTFAAAMKLVKPGDTLHIARNPEPYYESLVLRGNFGEGGKALRINGNNAVISGLVKIDAGQFEPRGKGFFYPVPKIPRNWKPRLFENGRMLPEAEKEELCRPGEFVWLRDGFFFIPAEGREPAGYVLSASLRDSGVLINTARNIEIMDLISEHHGNDGFNIHGSCRSLWFENIEGRYNGDDGFSAHEDAEAFVRNSRFHHNSYGIEDINLSRTFYDNVTVEDNLTGARFQGGEHSLTGCLIRNNGENVRIDTGIPALYLGDPQKEPKFRGHCFIKDSIVTGGRGGIRVTRGAALTLLNSLIDPGEAALDLGPDSDAFLVGSVLLGKRPLNINQAKLRGNKNLFFPDVMKIGDKLFDLEGLQAATGTNTDSVSMKPTVKDGKIVEQPFQKERPRLRLGPE